MGEEKGNENVVISDKIKENCPYPVFKSDNLLRCLLKDNLLNK